MNRIVISPDLCIVIKTKEKKMKKFTLIALFGLILLSSANAQTVLPENKWGIETEMVQPFIPGVGIIKFVGSYQPENIIADKKTELLFGLYFRPNVGNHDVVEEIDEYLTLLGFRQYLWKGLHIEAMNYLGYAWGTKNKIDGKDYADVAWLAEISVGYKFEVMSVGNSNLYVLPQFGFMKGIHTNIGPRKEADEFVTGELNIGMEF